MVTRKQLEEYRSGMREVRELRAKMRQAELSAMESETDSEKRRALELTARYEAMADEREDTLLAIITEIDALESADQRRVIHMRYVDGLSRTATAMRMGLSDSMVDKHCAAAIRELEKE